MIAIALLLALTGAGTERLKPGLWESTAKIAIEGMPHELPSITSTRCIRAAEIQSTADLIKMMQSPQQNDCRNQDVKLAGNKLTWKLICGGRAPGKGSAEIIFGGTEYHGSMQMELADVHGVHHKMSGTITGTRTGDCK